MAEVSELRSGKVSGEWVVVALWGEVPVAERLAVERVSLQEFAVFVFESAVVWR